MFPAIAACPPNIFTPSILGLLSLPLSELPTFFLCALTQIFLDLCVRFDFQFGQCLTMTIFSLVLFASFLFAYDVFIVFDVFENGRFNTQIKDWGTYLHGIAIRSKKHLIKGHLGSLFGVETMYIEFLSFSDFELLSGNGYYRKHMMSN